MNKKINESNYNKKRSREILFGSFLIITSFLLFVSLSSYFFTWEYDQSNINKILDRTINSENLLKKIGAEISHIFVYEGFGASSLIFSLLLFVTGLSLFFEFKKLSLINTWSWGLYYTILLSLILSQIKTVFPFLGGTVGYEISDFIIDYTGIIGFWSIVLFLTLFFNDVLASEKGNIIQNLKNINNLTFKFEQNINGKLEDGKCTIEYPKKIFCKYNLANKKILVSNGKSLVIKTLSSYYIYPLHKTPLNLILDKDYIIKKINNLDKKIIDDNFINFKFKENENEISIFFSKKSYNLIGWQTIDIYQNLSITYLSSVKKNIKIDNGIFKLPKQN